MQRLRQVRREEPTAERPPMPSASAGGEPQPLAPATVRVTWGMIQEQVDLQGMTVREAFQLLHGPLHIAPGVRANVNGAEVAVSHVLREGDELEFVRRAGEKGTR